uniref:Putative single-stranded DNA-binding protein n=1 Tax=viral metagenome TaxID=1070528 RepID=A0A6H1ZZN3_9ZZZZ
MSDLNLCQFIGRLGRSPEISYLPNGTAVAKFSIACGKKWKDSDGQAQEKTEWINLVAWRQLAEIIGKYLQKGSQVYVAGEMQTRSWEKDGIKKYMTEIVVKDMQMLGSKGDRQDTPPQQSAPVTSSAQAPLEDQDIPF